MKDYTDVTILLDRSASVKNLAGGIVKGFNAFIAEQAQVKGKATLSLYEFDNVLDTIFEEVVVQKAPPLTEAGFVPRNQSALLDAIGAAAIQTGERLRGLLPANRPDRIVFIVVTDGDETASTHHKRVEVAKMINHQRDIYKWQFVFLGADEDAVEIAERINIPEHTAMAFAPTEPGTLLAFHSASTSLRRFRLGDTDGYEVQQEDRNKQEELFKA